MKYDRRDGIKEFEEWWEYAKFHSLMNELNKQPIITNMDESIKFYNDFCVQFEFFKAGFIEERIKLDELQIISHATFNEALEPVVSSCKFDSKTEVFTMDFNFVPHVKSMYARDVYKIKNALIYLIMRGIKRMEEKPNYGKEPVLIIFTISNKYLFDVDNVEIKHIIDAMRYSQFFHDDSYNYVSYMVQGMETKGPSLMNVKVVKKSDKNY